MYTKKTIWEDKRTDLIVNENKYTDVFNPSRDLTEWTLLWKEKYFANKRCGKKSRQTPLEWVISILKSKIKRNQKSIKKYNDLIDKKKRDIVVFEDFLTILEI